MIEMNIEMSTDIRKEILASSVFGTPYNYLKKIYFI